MSAVLISGIGSLLYSGRIADLESARRKSGDYHYMIPDKTGWYEKAIKNPDTEDYTITDSGTITVKRKLEEPYNVTFCSADDGYMKCMGKALIEGEYPHKSGEIALDWYSINNLGVSSNIGDKVEICGGIYTLCGILNDGVQENVCVFVSADTELDMEEMQVLLKFDEDKKVFGQLNAFIKDYGIDYDTAKRNENVTSYVGGEPKESIFDTLKVSVTNPHAGIVYFLGSLNEGKNLMSNIVFVILSVFGAFVIYSLFEITIVKRTEQYAIMQVLGLEPKHLFGVMFLELFVISATGYFIGCIAGNIIAKLVYFNIGAIFSANKDITEFYISKKTVAYGAVFYLIFIIIICFMIIRKMVKNSDMKMIRNNITYKRFKRKIVSKKSHNISNVLTRRFMFGRLSTFVGIIISLSLGGVIFLSTTYVAQSTERNNSHAFKTDEGLYSDIRVYIDSDNGGYTIPQRTVDNISNINGVFKADAASYLLGEIPLSNSQYEWKEYYPETAGDGTKQDKRIIDNYNGIIVQDSDDSYRLKVNVYGYSDDMINELNDYLVEGKIDSSDIKDDNGVIVKLLTDGQGNIGGVDINPGDTITLKVPKAMNNPKLLRFESEDDKYVEKEFTVSAICSRPLAKNEYFIGDNGESQVDIIMSNEQMADNFGVSEYNNISIVLDDIEKTSYITAKIHNEINGLSRCMVKEYGEEINQRNRELKQKVYFFYGIAIILFCISTLHIVNSMKYIVVSRRHEFGIIRAMGITDRGFLKMLISEGVRYGIYTSIFMSVVYFAAHEIAHYMMIKVFLYIIAERNIMLMPCLIMSAVNIVICIISVIMAGRNILKEDIITEIRD